MKILLFGDASNFHQSLSIGLKRLGHDVTVVSNGSQWMNTDRDINIERRFPGKIGGLDLWIRSRYLYQSRLSGYDIVSLIGSCFIDLRPKRISAIFDMIKNNNRATFITALGTDSNYVRFCINDNCPLRYSEWAVSGAPSPYQLAHLNEKSLWLGQDLSNLCNKLYNETQGTVSVLYEYDLACRTALPAEKIVYGGIPIDVKSLTPVHIPEKLNKVKLFLGMHRDRKLEKGTDRIMIAAKKVAELHHDKCSLDIVENVPYNEYIQRMRTGHVVLDQLYSYTPATNALLAMAMGLNTMSGGEPEFYDFIGEKELRPVINILPDNDFLFKTIEETVLHPELIRERGLQGREFVLKHNDTEIVAKKFLNFWTSKLNQNHVTKA